ncbi:hypothetical protein [Pengzhenrongella phosphoraccumulans]|uniref:hypothetical protein n=1 Tax=Pengzhenrongella phosphoraccumulans TaxID=3114394 RepID=UPI00388FC8CA
MPMQGDPTAETIRSAFDDVERRATIAKIKSARFIISSEGYPDVGMLEIDIPNGKTTRTIEVESTHIEDLAAIQFEAFHFLGDYNAILNTTTGEIEAALASGTSSNGVTMVSSLWRLPGVEVLDENYPESDIAPPLRRAKPGKWHVTVASGDRSLQISPSSSTLKAFIPGRANQTSLKIVGETSRTQKEALAILETTGNAFLFDLDMRYDTNISFAERRGSRPTSAVQALEEAPNYPQNRYSDAPLSLYRYGRAASGLPLLQYLAFYQTLEYFFPIFAREEVAQRVRSELANPRFSPSSDEAISKIIALALGGGSNLGRERDQLRSTIRACVDEDTLIKFIQSTPEYTAHFTSSQAKSIQGVDSLRLTPAKGSAELIDQLADRIYAIRCRIVHTKQDGGAPGVDLLLPSSAESNALPPEVDLLRMLAQRVIVNRSTRLRT